jgi:carbon monoxide dehydrogenase subunit G
MGRSLTVDYLIRTSYHCRYQDTKNIKGGVQVAKFEESIEIKCPTERVFTYAADIKNLPAWQPTFSEIEQTSPGIIGIGTTFKGKAKAMGRRMAWTSKVTECVPNKKWSEEISAGSMLIKYQITYNPIVAGTKMSEIFEIQVGGILKLFAPMMVSSMRKQEKVNLAKLKEILEAKT